MRLPSLFVSTLNEIGTKKKKKKKKKKKRLNKKTTKRKINTNANVFYYGCCIIKNRKLKICSKL